MKYAGETREDKIARVRKEMEKAGAQVHVLSSLDDIVWLLNIRGNDIEYNPVVLSYMILTMDQVHFYVQEEAVPSEVRKELEEAGFEVRTEGHLGGAEEQSDRVNYICRKQ